jgi:hypothetical protein
MKKVLFFSIAVLFAASVVNGQGPKTGNGQNQETKKEVKSERKALRKLEGNNVSIVAKNKFAAQFATAANVLWKRVETFDEASFTLDGKAMKAFYDIEGNLVGTTTTKTFADLPLKGQQEIKAKYKNYSTGKVILFDDNEANNTDMLLYGIQFDDEDNYFVEMASGTQKVILKVNMAGTVSLFKKI